MAGPVKGAVPPPLLREKAPPAPPVPTPAPARTCSPEGSHKCRPPPGGAPSSTRTRSPAGSLKKAPPPPPVQAPAAARTSSAGSAPAQSSLRTHSPLAPRASEATARAASPVTVVLAPGVGLLKGARVRRRAADWDWGEQDGGAGQLGTIIAVDEHEGWCTVRWDHGGHSNDYRCGHRGRYDVEVLFTGSAPPSPRQRLRAQAAAAAAEQPASAPSSPAGAGPLPDARHGRWHSGGGAAQTPRGRSRFAAAAAPPPGGAPPPPSAAPSARSPPPPVVLPARGTPAVHTPRRGPRRTPPSAAATVRSPPPRRASPRSQRASPPRQWSPADQHRSAVLAPPPPARLGQPGSSPPRPLPGPRSPRRAVQRHWDEVGAAPPQSRGRVIVSGLEDDRDESVPLRGQGAAAAEPNMADVLASVSQLQRELHTRLSCSAPGAAEESPRGPTQLPASAAPAAPPAPAPAAPPAPPAAPAPESPLARRQRELQQWHRQLVHMLSRSPPRRAPPQAPLAAPEAAPPPPAAQPQAPPAAPKLSPPASSTGEWPRRGGSRSPPARLAVQPDKLQKLLRELEASGRPQAPPATPPPLEPEPPGASPVQRVVPPVVSGTPLFGSPPRTSPPPRPSPVPPPAPAPAPPPQQVQPPPLDRRLSPPARRLSPPPARGAPAEQHASGCDWLPQPPWARPAGGSATRPGTPRGAAWPRLSMTAAEARDTAPLPRLHLSGAPRSAPAGSSRSGRSSWSGAPSAEPMLIGMDISGVRDGLQSLRALLTHPSGSGGGGLPFTHPQAP
eukprot:TRINITY_DN37827_c0_g1_i1.p1 TRINITY_DN37827_c0_g1~~TRINITY_DN37827_c0_g1_i1.p1  ORF type:complete len:785 (+),score=99.93 TRINITY_DN37827_c0_g1_i1:71-2425(+)